MTKVGSSEQLGKHIRANSATRYAHSSQKPTLSKSQSVEEIRKKAQVNNNLETISNWARSVGSTTKM